MNQPYILAVHPASISDEDKEKLAAVGVIVIETETPADVKFLAPVPDLPSSVILSCAGQAIRANRASEQVFGQLVAAALTPKD